MNTGVGVLVERGSLRLPLLTNNPYLLSVDLPNTFVTTRSGCLEDVSNSDLSRPRKRKDCPRDRYENGDPGPWCEVLGDTVSS